MLPPRGSVGLHVFRAAQWAFTLQEQQDLWTSSHIHYLNNWLENILHNHVAVMVCTKKTTVFCGAVCKINGSLPKQSINLQVLSN